MKDKIIEILRTISSEYDFSGDEDVIEADMVASYELVTLVTNMEITFTFRLDGTDVVPENCGSVYSIAALLEKYGVH